jgi:hypothetical protein
MSSYVRSAKTYMSTSIHSAKTYMSSYVYSTKTYVYLCSFCKNLCLVMFILQKPMSSYVHSAKTYECLCPFCKNLCLAMFILQKPMSSYMHSTKTYGCWSKLALNPDPGREIPICCSAVVQVVGYMLYMLVRRCSRLFTIPQAILMYIYVRLQWE